MVAISQNIKSIRDQLPYLKKKASRNSEGFFTKNKNFYFTTRCWLFHITLS